MSPIICRNFAIFDIDISIYSICYIVIYKLKSFKMENKIILTRLYKHLIYNGVCIKRATNICYIILYKFVVRFYACI